MAKVAVSSVLSQGTFLTDTPANTTRGLETTTYLTIAKNDFADQTAVDTYVTARGGNTAMWKVLDLGAAGVK